MSGYTGATSVQYNLGVRYRQGGGVPLDLSEAARWIELAAKGGYSYAQNHWGVMLHFGSGVPKHILDAARRFIESARQHDVVALANLCHMEEEVEAVARTGSRLAQQYLAIIANLQKALDSDCPRHPIGSKMPLLLGLRVAEQREKFRRKCWSPCPTSLGRRESRNNLPSAHSNTSVQLYPPAQVWAGGFKQQAGWGMIELGI